MNWRSMGVAPDRTHHTTADGAPAYTERFDDVLKFHAPGLAPVSKGGAAWHIRADGSPAYPQTHRRTFGFYEGLAAVSNDHGWHHIQASGAAAYSQRFAWCGNFQEGRCAVRARDGTYLHIDRDGNPVSEERWGYAGDYRDGVAVVQATDGRSTHVDLHGRVIHGRWFLDLDVFHKGFARARDDDGWCHVDVAGRPVYSRRFAVVEPFYNGQARVERFDGALEVIDEGGQALWELRAPLHSEFAQLSADMVGFWRTQTISAAVELGVPDALPAMESGLAQRCRLSSEGTRRLLRALGELRLAQHKSGTWSLTPRGEFLRRDHPLTLADAALEYAGPFARMWADLAHAISEPSDWVAPDVFGQVADDDARREGHHRMLRSYARHDYPQLVPALELNDRDRVLDAGGGLGTLARMVVEAWPSVTVTVLDRPEVIDIGRRQMPSAGVQWQAGDLFEPWDVEADAVLLSRVLHDWNDLDAARILQRARQALSPSGRVFIIEMLSDPETFAGAQCDLHLLMATGGRERCREGYEQLLLQAGFRPAGVRRTAALPSILVGVAA